MPHDLPKYVKRVRSKGKEYLYFDTGKVVDGKRLMTRLPPLRSMEFGGSYAALMGHRNRKAKSALMTVPVLVDLYQRGAAYGALAPASRRLYDIYLRRLEKALPTAPVTGITRGDMRTLLDKMAATPGAANAFLRTSGALFAWATEREHIAKNPCDGITPMAGGEHEPWPAGVLRAGLVAEDAAVRLLVNLLYYTAQRLGDVLGMQWSDVEDDRISVVQDKTKKPMKIPIHSALKAELATRKQGEGAICRTIHGKPMRDDNARKILKAFSAAAGAPSVPHGLRKNAVIALLEAGCSAAQTAAVSGQSLLMVEHYAKQRDQSALADAAMLRWENRT
ncbi:tyrosine recombinase XerC [Sphingomonas sp. PP-CC-1A-547]|uniref:site-specific integrase n=1 Tax=Sphingomonas sp. PP-CC-1A-547 TaxID=2135654 RepID=UPI000E756D16|nr:tyrosine-type recombinase/integrase [Sphingomonas sp. PP-CC-1A-547]RKE50334.1 site-specific recombinase XerC [Sphingomonas sp. PP-CC-1A-547]